MELTSNGSSLFATQRQVPVIVGWGGSRLEESSTFYQAIASLVFLGEQASNQELQVQKLNLLGFNTIRVSFESACSSWREMGPYDAGNLARSIAIAEYYGFWIIIDYHGFDDLASSAGADCWLNYWRPIVEQFKNDYHKIIWEPLNEPINIEVGQLGSEYQRWIDQSRALGDSHWIVVQNLCSYGCGFSNKADGFPTVTDPVGKVFISLHSYMGYQYSSGWDEATAESYAREYYDAVLEGSSRTGWPVLNTEGGADELCDNCAPDEVLTGSAGYTLTTFHFIQTLTNLYDSASPQRVNWIWWAMGSWTNTPGAGLFGSLAADGWDSLLQYRRVDISTLTVTFAWQPAAPVPGEIVTFTALGTGGLPPYLFAWSFGDAGTGSGESVGHSYSQSGAYLVRVTATDDRGSTATSQSTINVGTPSPVGVTFTWQPMVPVAGESTTFTASATGGSPPHTFEWDFGDSTTGFGESAGHSYSRNGTYTVYVTATDALGSPASAQSIMVVGGPSIGNSPPVLTVPDPQEVSEGTTVAFTIHVFDQDSSQQVVTLSTTGLIPGSSFDYSTGGFLWIPSESQGPGKYNVSFTAYDGNGGIDVETVRFQVSEVNAPPELVLSGPKTVMPGSTISFTVNFTDPDIPQNSVVLTATGLVTGMSFDAATRRFSFTPEEGHAGGEFVIVFTATDDGSPPRSVSRSETIKAENSSTGGGCLLCVSGITPVSLLLFGGVIGLALSIAAFALKQRGRKLV